MKNLYLSICMLVSLSAFCGERSPFQIEFAEVHHTLMLPDKGVSLRYRDIGLSREVKVPFVEYKGYISTGYNHIGTEVEPIINEVKRIRNEANDELAIARVQLVLVDFNPQVIENAISSKDKTEEHTQIDETISEAFAKAYDKIHKISKVGLKGGFYTDLLANWSDEYIQDIKKYQPKNENEISYIINRNRFEFVKDELEINIKDMSGYYQLMAFIKEYSSKEGYPSLAEIESLLESVGHENIKNIKLRFSNQDGRNKVKKDLAEVREKINSLIQVERSKDRIESEIRLEINAKLAELGFDLQLRSGSDFINLQHEGGTKSVVATRLNDLYTQQVVENLKKIKGSDVVKRLDKMEPQLISIYSSQRDTDKTLNSLDNSKTQNSGSQVYSY